MRIRNRRDVANAWATQAKTTGKAASMFFEGATIYSYGYHFPIARLTTGRDGKPVALFTVRDYSVTTTAHKSLTAMALHRAGIKTFRVPHIVADFGYVGDDKKHAENVADLFARAAEATLKAKRARKYRDLHLEDAARFDAEAREYADTFGVTLNVECAA